MKVITLMLTAVVMMGCQTFNAAVDGGQDIVNKTIAATGEATADITQAIGGDVTDTITYGADGVADGIRQATGNTKEAQK
tara:strand:- start:75 stop:314 length:240 start_codon:yes stop_codon:yes gene_type:complete